MQVQIVLNPQQYQSRVLRAALDAAADDLAYAAETKSVGDLLALMRGFAKLASKVSVHVRRGNVVAFIEDFEISLGGPAGRSRCAARSRSSGLPM